MPIIHLLKVPIEARFAEAPVEHGKGADDAREELLEREGGQVRRQEGAQRGRRRRVGSVEADADDGEELGVGVVRVDEDAAHFEVGFLRGGLVGVESDWNGDGGGGC